MPAQSARVVGLALFGSAVALLTFAAAVYTGVVPIGEDLRGLLAGILGLVAAVDALIGFWFFRSSLTT